MTDILMSSGDKQFKSDYTADCLISLNFIILSSYLLSKKLKH